MAGNSLQQALEGLTVFIEGKRRVYEQYPDPELKEVIDIASEERTRKLNHGLIPAHVVGVLLILVCSSQQWPLFMLITMDGVTSAITNHAHHSMMNIKMKMEPLIMI